MNAAAAGAATGEAALARADATALARRGESRGAPTPGANSPDLKSVAVGAAAAVVVSVLVPLALSVLDEAYLMRGAAKTARALARAKARALGGRPAAASDSPSSGSAAARAVWPGTSQPASSASRSGGARGGGSRPARRTRSPSAPSRGQSERATRE